MCTFGYCSDLENIPVAINHDAGGYWSSKLAFPVPCKKHCTQKIKVTNLLSDGDIHSNVVIDYYVAYWSITTLQLHDKDTPEKAHIHDLL